MRIEEQKHQFNHTLHKEMWQWLSENPGKLEFDWPEYSKHFSECVSGFACMYAHSFPGYVSIVDCCYHRCPFPVVCASGSGEYRCYNGLYDKWMRATANIHITEKDTKKYQDLCSNASAYACVIRDLPLRTDIYISTI